jgi:hypothetical protein
MQFSPNKVEHYLKHNLTKVFKNRKVKKKGSTGINYAKLQNFSEHRHVCGCIEFSAVMAVWIAMQHSL